MATRAFNCFENHEANKTRVENKRGVLFLSATFVQNTFRSVNT